VKAHHLLEGFSKHLIVAASAAKKFNRVLVGFGFAESSPRPIALQDLGACDAD
jgi:hypothetical protein